MKKPQLLSTRLERSLKKLDSMDCIGATAIIARTVENANLSLLDMGYVETVQLIAADWFEKHEIKPSSYWESHDWVEAIENFTVKFLKK